MIFMHISGITPSKFAQLYEFPECRGRRIAVPAYQAELWSEANATRFDFSVTRDSSAIKFGETDEPFGPSGECPPSTREGFCGALHKTVNIPFGIRLYEPWCEKTISLTGTKDDVRTGILIHHGPARSEGCFLVAGGKAGFARFRQAVLALAAAEANPEDPDIRVIVDPR